MTLQRARKLDYNTVPLVYLRYWSWRGGMGEGRTLNKGKKWGGGGGELPCLLRYLTTYVR